MFHNQTAPPFFKGPILFKIHVTDDFNNSLSMLLAAGSGEISLDN